MRMYHRHSYKQSTSCNNRKYNQAFYRYIMRKKAPSRLPQTLTQNQKDKQQTPYSINKVYSMLNKQEETIANLLSKYGQHDTTSLISKRDHMPDSNSNGIYDLYLRPRSQTIDTDLNSSIKLKVMLTKNQIAENNNLYFSSRLRSRSRGKRQNSVQSYQNRSQSLSLPVIKQKNYVKQYKSNKNKIKNKYEVMSYFAKDKKNFEHDLYKIYGERNGYFNQIKYEQRQPKMLSIQKKHKKSLKKSRSKQKLSKGTRQSQQIQDSLSRTDNNQPNDQFIEPINPLESDDDEDSQAQDIPTMYYKRQFRDAMRAQCLEQLNFLYFSKNQQMRDWTDSLLSMIQKHDKEILGIRKKSKYLQTFDDKFFSIGIFNSDDL